MCNILFCCTECGRVARSRNHPKSTLSRIEPHLAAYFDHLFLTIANIDDKPSDLQKRKDTTVRQHALNSQEGTALQVATQAFQAGLNPLRQRVNVIVVGKRSLTLSDKAQLASIIQER